MTQNASRLLGEALSLSNGDRADMAARLLDSLDPEYEARAEAAWKSEVQRRINDLDGGRVKTVPWEEARRSIRGDAGDTASGDLSS